MTSSTVILVAKGTRHLVLWSNPIGVATSVCLHWKTKDSYTQTKKKKKKTNANILNKQFASVFSVDDGSPLPDLPDDYHPTMDNIIVCQNGVIKLLRILKPQDGMVFQQSFWERQLQRYHQQSPCCSRLQLIRAEFLTNGRRITSFPSIRKEVGFLQQTTAKSLWLECCANYVSIYFTVPSSVTSPTMRSCQTPSMGSENGAVVTPNRLSPWKTWPKDLTTNHKLVSSF